MPGFKIDGTGGTVGNAVETRRKHRWAFQAVTGGGVDVSKEVMLLLMSASRPHVTVEEVEMHHNQEKVWFAGKHSWEPITLVYYDALQPKDVSQAMWDWLNKIIDIKAVTVTPPDKYKAPTAKLFSIAGDADGETSGNETWEMYGAWPSDINWSDLDYTNTEIQKVEVTMRYDRAVRK